MSHSHVGEKIFGSTDTFVIGLFSSLRPSVMTNAPAVAPISTNRRAVEKSLGTSARV